MALKNIKEKHVASLSRFLFFLYHSLNLTFFNAVIIFSSQKNYNLIKGDYSTYAKTKQIYTAGKRSYV